MAVVRKRNFVATDPEAHFGFALQPHQISGTADPTMPTRYLLEADRERSDAGRATAQSARFVGRPYFVWKHDLELARKVNDALADRNLN